MDTRLLVLIPPSLLIVRWVWKTFIARHPLDNVQGPPSPSFWSGHMRLLFSSNPGRAFQSDIVDKYGRVVLLKGQAGSRQLYIADPRALQVVSVKEQEIFEHQQGHMAMRKQLLGEGILTVVGAQHRKQRKVLNPVFNVKHLRELVPVFTEITSLVRSISALSNISEEVKGGTGEVDLIVWLSRTALELIGVGGLGFSFGALTGEEHEYVASVKMASFSIFALSILRKYLPYVENLGTRGMRRAAVAAIPSKPIQNLRKAVDVMWRTTNEVFEKSKTAEGLQMDQKYRDMVAANNIMRVLQKSNQSADPQERMNDDEMKGQINSLILAANTTTSRSLSRIIHVLIEHPDYQERVRTEILAAREQTDGSLNFDQLEALPVMDAVIRETLRRYPPIPHQPRTCLKETVVPLMYPIQGRDGKTITELTIPAGTDVYIGIYPPNIDYETWGQDAREWKPERWMSSLPKSVGDAHIPGVFAHQMTFLAGNRSCIGFKFALLEIKVVLSMLLTHFRFSPGKQKIEWVNAGMYQPTVNKVMVPSMPVKVEVLSARKEESA